MSYLILRFLVVAVIIGLMTYLGYSLLKYAMEEHTSTKNVRNYVVRFEPENEKYYIVNALAGGDVAVVRWYGRRIFYKNKADAQFIVDKLNPPKE